MQSKWKSFIEAATGTLLSYIIGVGAGQFIYPLFDSDIDIYDNMGITLCFTCIALLRSYITRRCFNWLQTRKALRMEG